MKTIMKRALALMMTLALAITLMPVTSATAATKPKLSKTSATVVAGEKLSLSVKNAAKGATVKWSSSKKNVATVSTKGKVTGVKAGKSTVTAKVTSKGKTTSLKCKVTVTGTKTVATASQLKAALKNTKLTKINLKTSSSSTYTIPAGTYSNVALVVNAPNADVVNNGVFKSITIKAIAQDTFTENAVGNTIKITAAKAHVVVSESAKPVQISIATAKSEVAIEANGSVGKIAVDAAATVKVSGTAKESVPVTVAAAAKDATITSSIPVAVTAAADVKVELEKGAEGSAVTVTEKSASASVQNGTTDKVSVTTTSGTNSVAAGATVTTTPDTSSATTTPTNDVTPVSGASATKLSSANIQIMDQAVLTALNKKYEWVTPEKIATFGKNLQITANKSDDTKLTVSGVLNEIEWAAFSTGDDLKKGYYLPIQMEIPSYVNINNASIKYSTGYGSEDNKWVTTPVEAEDLDEINGVTYYTNFIIIVKQAEGASLPTGFKITVDWDGTTGTEYAEREYTVDINSLQLGENAVVDDEQGNTGDEGEEGGVIEYGVTYSFDGSYSADDKNIVVAEDGITVGEDATSLVAYNGKTVNILQNNNSKITLNVTGEKDSDLPQVAYFKAIGDENAVTYYSVSQEAYEKVPEATTENIEVVYTVKKLESADEAAEALAAMDKAIEDLAGGINDTEGSYIIKIDNEDIKANYEIVTGSDTSLKAINENGGIEVIATQAVTPAPQFTVTVSSDNAEGATLSQTYNVTITGSESIESVNVALATED